LALVHDTKIVQYHCTKLDARWREPYQVTEIAQRFGTYRLAEPDGAELAGWIDGSGLKKIFTRNERVHSTPEIGMLSSVYEAELAKFEGFEVKAVAGRKYIKG
jgi:hypothetical protein